MCVRGYIIFQTMLVQVCVLDDCSTFYKKTYSQKYIEELKIL